MYSPEYITFILSGIIATPVSTHFCSSQKISIFTIRKKIQQKYVERRPWRMNCKHVHIMWNQYQIILCTLCDSIKFLALYIEPLYPTEHRQKRKTHAQFSHRACPSYPPNPPIAPPPPHCWRKRRVESFPSTPLPVFVL
jgi:hypothetical protein